MKHGPNYSYTEDQTLSLATMDMNATGPLDVHAAVVTLITAMRRDCFNGSKLNSDEFEYVVPIGKPTPSSGSTEGHFEPS